jgi:hypothetical protein
MANTPVDLFGEADPSFEKGTAPERVGHATVEIRAKFLPWHKPRKQYVRNEQWGKSIDSLVDKLALNKDKPLYYLSLPGPDLLDVRSLQPIFLRKEVPLSFIGLNGGADNDAASATLNAVLLSEVMSLPSIDPSSSVVPDLFEHLAKPKSIAYNRIIAERRSFDVINIDLCSSLAEGPSGVKGANNINALYRLIQHQASFRKHDWLLFLTTRSNEDMIDRGTMVSLLEALNKLIDNDPSMLPDLIGAGLIQHGEVTSGRIDLSKLSPESYSNSFAVGISHWILMAVFANDPGWKIDMLPQFGYHVALKDNACDMLSLGFYCKRLPIPLPEDPSGLAVSDQAPGPDIVATQDKCYKNVRRRVSESNDVDIKLHKDAALYSQCLDESALLLKNARYDETEYRKFAEVERLKLANFLEINNLI